MGDWLYCHLFENAAHVYVHAWGVLKLLSELLAASEKGNALRRFLHNNEHPEIPLQAWIRDQPPFLSPFLVHANYLFYTR